jgi:hypothetical protein
MMNLRYLGRPRVGRRSAFARLLEVRAQHRSLPSAVVERARIMAAKMPLVHFPASTSIAIWNTWAALRSGRDRGEKPPSGRFGRLRWQHVYTYAGPCCFGRPDAVGDAAMYFAPSCEEGRTGSASPFDSGALEPPDARLRPWADAPVDTRWRFFSRHCLPLASWRAVFRDWLLSCYERPERYLATSSDRYADGLPDYTVPEELRTHNGPQGQRRYGPGIAVADRRAWTWEVRFVGPVPLDHVMVLQVPLRSREMAVRLQKRLYRESGSSFKIRMLPPHVLPSPQALYKDSGPLLIELTQ